MEEWLVFICSMFFFFPFLLLLVLDCFQQLSGSLLTYRSISVVFLGGVNHTWVKDQTGVSCMQGKLPNPLYYLSSPSVWEVSFFNWVHSIKREWWGRKWTHVLTARSINHSISLNHSKESPSSLISMTDVTTRSPSQSEKILEST